ncbi:MULTISPECIES: 6-phosphogluconolactonase [unclassified Luteibacter]|uniref:6-phosphogluconolactonase n=1 Tax=unclassified Luteibacter TaxID=2620188 RepID=UPI0008B1ED8D|nr:MULTISPECIES: 6-phosphogluconolactonase [unclassified Luteibacter]SEO37086.1 6-phosphogluconolactonase [Luteibacter sp. UNC138MFCol5.1]SEW29060.1 6-phosphogluconolactonase [Luteibacter sp. 329MFSha]
MNAKIERHEFTDKLSLADQLARDVAAKLKQAIDARGKATLAVSGGSTPKMMFAVLAEQEIDWSKVAITLVDERWVDVDSERSNARLVAAHLLHHEAHAATFLPLFDKAHADDVDKALGAVGARVDALGLPFDVVILGMGGDGHTASFFPGGDNLAEALDPKGTKTVLSMRAPDAGEPRITLTLPKVLDTRALYVHIEGADKKDILAKAEAGEDYPIGAVLKNAKGPVEVYWAP